MNFRHKKSSSVDESRSALSAAGLCQTVIILVTWGYTVINYHLRSASLSTGVNRPSDQVIWGQPRIRCYGAFRVMSIITDDKRWLCHRNMSYFENFSLFLSPLSFLFLHKKPVLKLARMLFLTKTYMKFSSLLSKYFSLDLRIL